MTDWQVTEKIIKERARLICNFFPRHSLFLSLPNDHLLSQEELKQQR